MLEHRELLRPDSAWRESLRPPAVRVLDGQSSDDEAKESSLRLPCWKAGYETVFGIVSLNGRACLRLVETEEARRGRRYDVVTKLRPDEQICEPWPSWRRFEWRGGPCVLAHFEGPTRAPNRASWTMWRSWRAAWPTLILAPFRC